MSEYKSTFRPFNPLTDELTFSQPQFAPDFETAALSRPSETYGVFEAGRVRACYSLWLEATPMVGDTPSICAGHLYADDEDGAVRVLEDILHRTQALGRPLLAPMDGSTWFAYRVMLDPGTQPLFFLEKPTAPFWPKVFEGAGFSLAARYRSSRRTALDYEDRAAAIWGPRIKAGEVLIRPIDLTKVESELDALYELSLTSFARNHFYTPISRRDFHALYRPVLGRLDPSFILLAARKASAGERVCGFIFGVPDLIQARRGVVVDTVVIKTLAVRPGRENAGLGAYLAHRLHTDCAQKGFKSAIHAYMFDGNSSRVISDRSATLVRSYGLYVKP